MEASNATQPLINKTIGNTKYKYYNIKHIIAIIQKFQQSTNNTLLIIILTNFFKMIDHKEKKLFQKIANPK